MEIDSSVINGGPSFALGAAHQYTATGPVPPQQVLPKYGGFTIKDNLKAAAHGGVVVNTPYGQGTLIRFELDKAYVRLSWGSEIVIQANKVQFHQQHSVESIASEINAQNAGNLNVNNVGASSIGLGGVNGAGFGYYCPLKSDNSIVGANPLKRRHASGMDGDVSESESTTVSKSHAGGFDYKRPMLSPDSMLDEDTLMGDTDDDALGGQQGGVKRVRRQEAAPASLAT